MYPIECPEERNAEKETHLVDSSSSPSGERNIDSEDDHENKDDDINYDTSGDQSKVQTIRPTRKAVIKARQKLKQWLNPGEDEVSVGSVADHAKLVT